MQDLLRTISSGYFFDVIPIDLTLHCIIGALVTIFCLVQRVGHTFTFLVLLSLAGVKEINDYFFHQFAGWEEYATDFVITFFYFGLSLLIRRFKGLANKPKKFKKIDLNR